MTIRSKLIANVLVTAVIVLAISAASFLSMRFLWNKLSYLTEKSTPFQVLTIELQREMQACISSLVKLNSARNIAEYAVLREETEKKLTSVENAQSALKKIGNGAVDVNVSFELDTIALELFSASEDRINSSDSAAAANAKVMLSMKESTARLDDLDSYVGNLQANLSRAYLSALETTGALSGRLQSIEELRNQVRELQLLAVTVQNAKTGSTVLIAKGKLKAISGRISKNEYFRLNRSIAATSSSFIDNLAEHIRLQSESLSQKDDDSAKRVALSGQDISIKLHDLFQTLDQETMLVRDELALASSRQVNVFKLSNIANDTQVENSQLISLGLMVSAETNRLLAIESITELDKIDVRIRSLFKKIAEREKELEKYLVKLKADEELKILRDASASLASVRSRIYSADGMLSALKRKLNAITRADSSADKLKKIVNQQSRKGTESILIAKGEQDRAIEAVNSVIMKSRLQVLGIGLAAVLFGILFGLWIYRSVLIPLRLIQDSVQTKKKQAHEKALLAEAVAGGDLNRNVAISEELKIDRNLIKNDEMGMVLHAVVDMSAAQVVLDTAFADMTAALRISRDEEIRRDHLKSGLNEINNILRIEQKTSDMADRSLAFMAAFINAGVGILYLYAESEGKLRVISTYAMAGSRRQKEDLSIGEGLIGQAARERKIIILDAVPPDYLPISSALGTADSPTVAVLPILHNDVLLGVLELGSFRKFTEDDLNFLNQALEGLAIAININKSRKMVDGLLEQAQQQAEELRVSQEELQQTNEELLERARMLSELRHTGDK